MFSLRRAAFRALSISSRPIAPQTRSISFITAREAFQTRKQLSPFAFQRRFASDDVTKPSEEKSAAAQTAAEASVAEPGDGAGAAAESKEGVVSQEPVSEKQAEAVTEATPAARSPESTGFQSEKPRGVRIAASETTLYVGNLFFEVTEKDLQQRFEQYGPVKKTSIIYDPRGLSKGFGYIEFENKEDAQEAIRQADQDVFHGRRMAVQQHKPRERPQRPGLNNPNEPSKTLFIGNMSYEMSDKDLNDLFRQIKGVVDVRVAIDRNTGQPRGFAHADFTDVESAANARDYLGNKEMYGRSLRVDFSRSSHGGRPA